MSAESSSSSWRPSQPSLLRRAIDARDPAAARAAREELCRRYEAPIRRAVERRAPPGSRCDELVADVWHALLATDALASYERTRGRFRAWVQGIVANVVRAHARARARTRRELEEVDELADARELDPAFVAEEERAWAGQVVANALRRLGELHPNDVLVLCAPAGAFGHAREDHAALARRLGLTHGALHTAATRARARLEELLDDELRQSVDDERAFQAERAELRGRLLEAAALLGARATASG